MARGRVGRAFWYHSPHGEAMRSWVIGVTICLSCGVVGARGKRRPLSLSINRLLTLVRTARHPRATLASLARRIDRRLRKPAQLSFVKEATDLSHLALSTPYDLPKAEYPHRAVLRWRAKAFGRPAILRLLAPLAALDPKRRGVLVKDRALTLVLMITAARRDKPFPLHRVERLANRLRLHVFTGGELGSCNKAREYCSNREYALRGNRRKRAGRLLYELRGNKEVGGIKLIVLGARPSR